jgi:hypothetical protein
MGLPPPRAPPQPAAVRAISPPPFSNSGRAGAPHRLCSHHTCQRWRAPISSTFSFLFASPQTWLTSPTSPCAGRRAARPQESPYAIFTTVVSAPSGERRPQTGILQIDHQLTSASRPWCCRIRPTPPFLAEAPPPPRSTTAPSLLCRIHAAPPLG